ncbi:hypothetical protein GY45DRAFT_1373615 [Cubamyces sp. BRFM 1775]|nr:hypothetical protein GY45DRAFT_1373615 [Cubamyces sp. BRFM 1775]
MDTLPLETLQRILTLACTALSLGTSRTIRAASRVARFHTIALIANPCRLDSFLALYERQCEVVGEDRPRIRHLHATFPRDRTRYYSPSLSPLHCAGTTFKAVIRVMTAASTSGLLNPHRYEKDISYMRVASPRTDQQGYYSEVQGVAEDYATYHAEQDEFPGRQPQEDPVSSPESDLIIPPRSPSSSRSSEFATGHVYAMPSSESYRPSESDSSNASDADDSDWPRATESLDEDITVPSPEYIDAARRLFYLVSPDLWTVVLQRGFRASRLLCIPCPLPPFPALRELTLVKIYYSISGLGMDPPHPPPTLIL